MPSRQLILVGIVSGLLGAIAGGAIASGVARRPAPKAAPAQGPDATPSGFFQTFDPRLLAEAISGRTYAGGGVTGSSSGASGGGLRWGERSFTACWERGEVPRDQQAADLEGRIDEALSGAGMQCANPVEGSWSGGESGVVYSMQRRYQSPGHVGVLRAWLVVGERGRQSALILTVDEQP